MKRFACNVDGGLFLARLALAGVFIAHGIQKFTAMQATIAFFATLGLAPFFTYLVAGVELIGGIAMLLGLGARIAGILLAAVMAMAILMVKLKAGFIGGYEFDLTLLLVAVAIAVAGPGTYSIWKGCKHGE